MKVKKLSDYTGSSTEVLHIAHYIGEAITDDVTELEVVPGQLDCFYNYFKIPIDWDFKIWGIKIKVIKLENN